MEDIFLESSRAEFWLDSQVLLLCSSSKAYLEFPVKMALDVLSLLLYHWGGKRKRKKKASYDGGSEAMRQFCLPKTRSASSNTSPAQTQEQERPVTGEIKALRIELSKN